MPNVFLRRVPLRRSIGGAFALAMLAACGGTDGPASPKMPEVHRVDVSLGTVRPTAGQTVTATAQAYDAVGAPIIGIRMAWSSSNPAVARIDSTGTVSAIAPGLAAIRATAAGVEGAAALEVLPVPVAEVRILNSPPSMIAGESVQLTAVARDSRGNELRDRAMTWSVSPATHATVSAQGLLTGVSPGIVIVAVAAEGVTASTTVTIAQPRAAAVEVRLASATLVIGQSTTATATAFDARGGVIPGKRPLWSSSATAVATIDSAGIVTTVSTGTSVLTATIDGQVGSATLTVTPVPVASLTVTSAPQTMVAGSTAVLQVVVRDAAGNTLTGRSVTFASSAPAVAQVSSQGTLTAVSSGSATITASSEGISTTFMVTVRERVASVVLSSTSANLQRGRSLQLTATARDAAGRPIPGVPVTWASADAAIATVSSSGLVTGTGIGSVPIRAMMEDREASAWISGWDTCEDEPISIGMARNGFLVGSDCNLWVAEPQASVFRLTASSLTFAPALYADVLGLGTWGWFRTTPGTIGMEVIAPPGPVAILVRDYNRLVPNGGFSLSTGLVVGDTVSCGGRVALLQGGAAARSLRPQDCSTSTGHYFDILTVRLAAGRTLTFTMASFDFDAYLEVRTGDGSGVLAFDNNSAGGTNARVRFTATATGFFQIWARAAVPFRTGQYTIEAVP
jgi:hypothetical protein